MTFIFFLILINFFLFLPRYILGLPKKWNPFTFLFSGKSIFNKLRNIYFSRSIDPFRLSIEYSLLVIVIFSFDLDNVWTLGFLNIVAIFIFAFNTYLTIFTNFLHRTPVIKSDWLFMKNAIAFYKGYVLLLGGILVILLMGLNYIFSLTNQLLAAQPIHLLYNLFFLILVLALGLFRIKIYPLNMYMHRTVFSVIVYLFKSAQRENKYDYLLNFSKEEIEAFNLFKDISLKKKPNIHIISMESYGSVIFKEQDKYQKARKSLDTWNEKFNHSDIKVLSSFAIPPLFAVGTWYSYSSLLFGMKIDNSIQYNILFKDMPNFPSYESLFQFTQREGYSNFLLHGLLGDFDDTLDFEKFKRNLNYDYFIQNKLLDYKGQSLEFIRMQKAAPDQFTLNKGLDIAKKNNDPYTLFFCTLNSHWDFDSPVQIVDDWTMLSDESFSFKTTKNGYRSPVEKYAQAIDYTINTVFDTIMKRMNDNDIYIVYGDHQPTTLTDEKYGKETPMHIFSKNEAFLKEWEKHGFTKGVVPQKQNEPLKLEAFYSAFISALNKNYGENTNLDIPFFKDGIKLS